MAEIITTQKAADALGVSVQRVRQLIRELGITPAKVGNAIVLTPADLKRMRARNTQRGPKVKR